ncbi:isochorismatase family protein [Actinokineospora diospyrosa]|uniref:Nicotinamidase-related amidase n=1 Tax=Actinokineospora diospyrosa TaxID=103728 RepID=A0ABT1IJ92_9PSEU|nr:isochorismatase family protein [Actinokineospora diospyrosa]MCP2272722.1 Nicotinamidase-related amidase [Actinokineospora diospyrosa]
MTTLSDRPGTAVVIIDVQNAVVANAHEREAVIGKINVLLDRARTAGVPVVWVQDNGGDHPNGSHGWEIVPELAPLESEPRVQKEYGDSFEETDLESVLADLRVGSLVVAGAQTDACVRSTLHGAVARGYDTTLVSDAHTTEDFTEYGAPSPDKVIAHTNLYWSFHSAPGRTAGIAPAAEVALGSA